MKNTLELKQGIKIHLINSKAYKTDLSCVFLTTALTRENVTYNALIPFLLRRGTNTFKDQYIINQKLDNMYGASLNLGVDKYGDNVVLKFYIESINNEYAFDSENILKESINMLIDIVFNPLKKDGKLNEEFLEVEKDNLRKVIESKIDDKDSYALDSCISSMYGENGFGLYKYGYLEDIDNITIDSITDYYNHLIDNAKIDIFVSGNINAEEVKKYVEENENINLLKPRIENYKLNNEFTESKEKVEKPKEIFEQMNVTQGKLVIGLDILEKVDNFQATAIMFNSILGDGANSMLFQNVREKEGLAYSARSSFVKQKLNIFIRCGIQIENYNKALEKIKEQLENIKNGNFTEENIENAKTYLISGIKNIKEEQDTEIVFYIGQEISKTNLEPDEYINRIKDVKKEDIVNFAKLIQINTIYFLKN